MFQSLSGEKMPADASFVQRHPSMQVISRASAVVMLVLASISLLAPQSAQAMNAMMGDMLGGYQTPIPTNMNNMCANCHTDWGGQETGNNIRPAYWLFDNVQDNTASALFKGYDSDRDGSTNDAEFQASQSATMGTTYPVTRWFPNYADKDQDGCIALYTRSDESGLPLVPLAIETSCLTCIKPFLRFVPNGWDEDDNDHLQGCSAAWPTTATLGDFATPPGTLDTTPPAKINNFRYSGAAMVAAAVPLTWTAVGDDGNTGTAYDYDLRYTTPTALTMKLCGGVQCQPRDVAHWGLMYDMLDTDIEGTDTKSVTTILTKNGPVAGVSGAVWNTGVAQSPLMRAINEPLPSAPSTTQSFTLQTIGSTATTNTIGTGLHWLAIRVGDGVLKLKPGSTVNVPTGFIENVTLSNIIAVTTGSTGAAITSYTPTAPVTLGSTILVTMTGLGIGSAGSANSAQLALVKADGTLQSMISTGRGSHTTTTVSGTFPNSVPSGTYTLETRTSAGVTTAAWVDAITVTAAAPSLTSIAPTIGGRGAQSLTVTLGGSNLTAGTLSFTGTGITPAPATVSGTGPWSAIINIASDAALTTRDATVATSGGSSTLPGRFTVSAAPTISCTPATPGTGTFAAPFNHTCTAAGGTTPYTWSATGLPPGVSFSGGVYSGSPTAVNSTPITGAVTVVDRYKGTTSLATSITVAQASQTITSFTCTSPIVFGGTGTCSATGGASGNPVTFTAAPAAVCTASGTNGSIITGVGVGTCTVTAGQASSTNYSAAGATTTNVAVGLASQTISCGTAPTVVYNGTGTLSCTASPSGLAVSYSSDTSATCSVNSSSGVVTGLAAGTNNCTIRAVQGGNASYSPASPVLTTFSIGKASQTIGTITFTPNTLTAGGTTAASATATSGLAVTFSSMTPSICTVSGNTVTSVAAGTCSIHADQGGNTNFNAAPQVMQDIPVADGGGSHIDLVMTVVSPTTTAVGAGESLSIINTEKNQGSLTMTATTHNIKFYLSADAIFTTTSPDILIGSRTVSGALIGGAETTATSIFTVPTTTTPGTYIVAAMADGSNQQAETNEFGTGEGNNWLGATTITVIRDVDLIMTTVSTTATSVVAGTTFAISNTEKNDGTTVSTASNTIKFYLSTDGVIATTDIALTGTRIVPAPLAAGVSSPTSGSTLTTVTVPAGTPAGIYTYGACADATFAQLFETKNSVAAEGNNCTAGGTITVLRNVDLVMSVVSSPVTSVGAGHTFTIVNTELNQGNTQTTASNTIKFYLSTDGVITTTDIALTGTRVVTFLLPGASSSADTIVTVPKLTAPGFYTFGACADALNTEVLETKADVAAENNNCTAGGTINVIRDVDLVMSAVSTTATSVVAGATFAIANTETNNGSTMATVSNTIRFYLSADGVVTTTDIALTGTRIVTALLPGAITATTATTVTVPGTVLAGNYTYGACADALDTQKLETNSGVAAEGNNCTAGGTITVLRDVDLVMSAVSSPDTSVGAGHTFTIANTERNDGNTQTTASNTIKFYLSTDSVVTTADIALTGFRAVASLAAGASSTASATVVTVPKLTAPGSYTFGACADVLNTQTFETKAGVAAENNNCTAGGTINVIRDVDLVMSAVSTTATSVVAGATFTITNTETNNGSTMATVSNTIKFYLTPGSGGTITTTSIALTGTRVVATLLNGASSPASGSVLTTVTVPVGTPVGTYTYGACADALDTQKLETNSGGGVAAEGNNCAAGLTTIDVI